MPPALELTIPPVPAQVARLVEAVEGFAEEAGLPPRAAHHLALVVEELAANVVMHGSRGEGAASFVSVSVHRRGEDVIAIIEDDGRPFDPLSRPPADTETSLEEREVGGLGVHFVRQVTRSVDYAREAGRNRLTAVLDATG